MARNKRAMALRNRLMHWWFLVRRPVTLGARAIVLDGEGRVLLVKHSYVAGWHLPGGGVEPGETALDCVRREIAEEANVSLGAPLRLHAFYFNPAASVRDHVALYVCEGAVQTAPKAADREILAAGFFALEALPEDITQATARRLAEWRSGSEPDPVW